MDSRLLLVAGLFAVVFAAGVGQSVVRSPDADVAAVVDEAVQGDGVAPEPSAADGTDQERRTEADGPSADGRTGADGDTAAGSAGDRTDGEGRAVAEATQAGGAPAAEDSAGQPFRFRIESIEQCGRTCRDVTATLVNGQALAASDLVVETAIYTGTDTTDGDRIWRDSERVGTLAAGAEHTSTRTVDLGWGGGLAVKRADGWITVETTVETADRSVTLERQREVT